MRLKSVKQHLEAKLKNKAFSELYELEQEKMKLAKLIVDYRIKHDLTQTDLARSLNITQQYVSKLEEANFSNIADVFRILLALGYKLGFKVSPVPH